MEHHKLNSRFEKKETLTKKHYGLQFLKKNIHSPIDTTDNSFFNPLDRTHFGHRLPEIFLQWRHKEGWERWLSNVPVAVFREAIMSRPPGEVDHESTLRSYSCWPQLMQIRYFQIATWTFPRPILSTNPYHSLSSTPEAILTN